MSQIVRGVILESKEFHSIDVLDNNEAQKLKAESEKYQWQAFENFGNGLFDISYQAFTLSVIAKAQGHHIRENLVSEEITELKTKYSNQWKDKQICVIQGMSHRDTYRIFKRDNPQVKTSRSFLLKDRFAFPLIMESKSRLLHGSVENREATLKREFLSQFVIFPRILNTSSNEDLVFENANKIARSLTLGELESIFTQLSDIQKFVRDMPFTARHSYVEKHVEIIGQQIVESHPQI